ncbi:MAG: ferredoxin-thioredoxin reductase catalytic domain-containing protein [Candidatus Eisenbacteria bacterium]
MSTDSSIPNEETEALRAVLDRDAESSGYHLNPDPAFSGALAEGLLVNEGRFGYGSCPCRLASGDAAEDLDIVCPCDYRDADLAEWGACYCALYVSKEVLEGGRALEAIPERRPATQDQRARVSAVPQGGAAPGKGSLPVWRCRVCGYLCAREQPPETCPICKASRERFERFWE